MANQADNPPSSYQITPTTAHRSNTNRPRISNAASRAFVVSSVASNVAFISSAISDSRAGRWMDSGGKIGFEALDVGCGGGEVHVQGHSPASGAEHSFPGYCGPVTESTK